MPDKKGAKNVYKVNFEMVHRFKAMVALIAFCVIVVSGVRAQVSLYTILFKATVAIVAIILVSIVVLRALAAYEEMNGGEG
jgi:hypothetical protein